MQMHHEEVVSRATVHHCMRHMMKLAKPLSKRPTMSCEDEYTHCSITQNKEREKERDGEKDNEKIN